MKFTAATLAVAIGQAAASGWTDAPSFSCPSSANNQCNAQQQSGWSWSDLSTGSFSSYAGFNFQGWSCENSFAKRDLTERDFQDKCITGSLSQGSGPSFSCGESNGFSIDTYQITVSEEVDVEFVYQMEGGQTCKHTNMCSPGGTVVQNTQCGGAKQVSFQLGAGASSSCSIGIHSIGFYCNSASSSAPARTSVPAQSSSAPVVQSTPTSAPVYPSSAQSSSGAPSSPVSAVQSSSVAPSSPAVYSSWPQSSSSAPSSPASAVQSSSGAPSSPAVYPSSSSAAPVVNTSPVPSSPGAPSSSVPLPVYSSPAPSSPAPSSGCPSVVPSCLNTWLKLTTCADNSDNDCFCQDDTFVANVIACVQSWGEDIEVQAALSYFVGICAPWVPKHPGIVTNCPSTIPLSPSGSPTTLPAPETEVVSTTVIVSTTVTTCPVGQTITHASGTTVLASPVTSTIYVTTTSTICTKCEAKSTPAGPITTAPTTPYTTITVVTSVTVPCTYSTGSSAGQPIPSSSTVAPYSTCVTVPQVSFTTVTAPGASTPSVGLGVGSPTATPPVASTPAGGIATTTGFYTSYGPSGTKSNGTYTGGLPAQVTTNAGVMVSSGSIVSLLAGVVVAALAL